MTGLMIDWLTFCVHLRHPYINGGHVQSIDSDGVERWMLPTAKSFEGSFESSVQVKSNDVTECRQFAQTLYVSGNPSKFLQGHNIIGSDNMNLLVERMLETLAPLVGFVFDDLTRQRVRRGDYSVKRIDINGMYALPTLFDVRAFIDAAGMKSRSRHGRCIVQKGTFYYGKNSKRWAIKGYSKYDEIMRGEKGHRLPAHLLNSPLLAFCENLLRLELVLRAPELKKITDSENTSAHQLMQLGLQNIFNDYLSRLDMAAQVSLRCDQMAKLPSKVQGTYALWRQGFDVRSTLPKATFYRHRAELQQFDIDISLPFDSADNHASHVVPLIRVLEAKPVSVPSHLLQYIVH